MPSIILTIPLLTHESLYLSIELRLFARAAGSSASVRRSTCAYLASAASIAAFSLSPQSDPFPSR